MGRPFGSGVRPAEERFWRMVEKGPGCWRWMGATAHGYGVIGIRRGKNVGAHRLSYEIHNGPIAEGLFVCHRCDNPRCVNPAHLFLGTAADNHRDMCEKGRGVTPNLGEWQKSKTHCKWGHEFTPENTMRTRNGRRCRECNRRFARESYARLRNTYSGLAS